MPASKQELSPKLERKLPAKDDESGQEEARASTGLMTDRIDMDTFQQILELDDEDSTDFSKGMVWAYFEQAEQTFGDMKKASEEKDLDRLSSLGHFLKGSSAALGVSHVQRICEEIQNLGHLRSEDGTKDIAADMALERIRKLLVDVRKEYDLAKTWLTDYYEAPGGEEGE